MMVFLVLSHVSYAEKVQDVFIDIEPSYPYLYELQKLYDKGVISVPQDKKFQPNSLLNRDEFVGISMETMCKKCIMPYTDSSLLGQYQNTNPFFDVPKENKYFYCIADATQNNFVAGYDAWYVCQDGTTRTWEKPFCINNRITLDEAVAVLLRNANIFSQTENQEVIAQINAWVITQKIANDVSPLTTDGGAYTFYGYLQKGLSYEVKEYDAYGVEKTYRFLTKDASGNLNPKKYITKEEFLKLAYIMTLSNSCNIQKWGTTSENVLATQLQVFPKTCSVSDPNCSVSDLQERDGTYDFKNQVKTTCESGIKEVKWIFLNTTTGESFSQTGTYLDNQKFPSYGNWQVRSIALDFCWGYGESFSHIVYNPENNNPQLNPLTVQIRANPIYGQWPLKVDFESVVSGCNNCRYEWNFGDGGVSSEKNPTHIFIKPWVYEVVLTIKDTSGKSSQAQVIIRVDWETGAVDVDTDGDGILDKNDKCITVPGDVFNSWCPVLSKKCDVTNVNSCGAWFTCSAQGTCEVISEQIQTCILPDSGSSIFWSLACNSCPCQYKLDFLANIRRCDQIFPAITSPGWTQIYSRWEIFQVPYK